MKYQIKKIKYGYVLGYEEGKIFSEAMKMYHLTLVEAGAWKKKVYLVREKDLEWLLNEDCVDKKRKIKDINVNLRFFQTHKVLAV